MVAKDALYLFSPLNSYLTWDKCTIDHVIFRIQTKYTMLLLMGAAILVGWQQFFYGPIHCVTEKEIPKTVMDTFCWIHATFTLPNRYYDNASMPEAHPGVGNQSPDEQSHHHTYYQWVFYTLLFQALVFGLPQYLWHHLENFRVFNLINFGLLLRTSDKRLPPFPKPQELMPTLCEFHSSGKTVCEEAKANKRMCVPLVGREKCCVCEPKLCGDCGKVFETKVLPSPSRPLCSQCKPPGSSASDLCSKCKPIHVKYAPNKCSCEPLECSNCSDKFCRHELECKECHKSIQLSHYRCKPVDGCLECITQLIIGRVVDKHLEESKGIKKYTRYFWSYVSCEALATLNVIFQYCLMHIFLDGFFFRYGIKLWSLSELDPEDRDDVFSIIFPKVGKCTFEKVGPSGTIQHFDALCVLPVNVYNEKVYIFFWFWLSIVLALSGGLLIYRLATIFSGHIRKRVLRRLTPKAKINDEDFATFTEKLDIGEWFYLCQLGKNMNHGIFGDILARLNKTLPAQPKRHSQISQKRSLGTKSGPLKSLGGFKIQWTVHFQGGTPSSVSPFDPH
eukprot:snap_masked-scaffold11_size778918-processed-gene-3.9 protein:Tk03667 transcript:snap_masked-scaffold11_size778918-processed-gene-3.9-mRNA-1 annotation:"innexin 2"